MILRRSMLALVPASAVAQRSLRRTPEQMEGPFYPRAIPDDADADLRRVIGASREARGRPLLLEGFVRNIVGVPLPGARIEIWQADSQGIYLHPSDRIAQRDTGFQGYGRATADAQGRYAFRTIRPGRYSGRTPHIHLRADMPEGGAPLTTQVYFPDEPGNARDGLFSRTPEAERPLLVARLEATDDGQRAIFDIFTSRLERGLPSR
ncbi:dioxygenase family protein [Plastoroseomonas arctica]|uniref:Intradiol ring-cleavage dioxygenase n=1 Tax=Plastoroseomonas arctica TaxID=1509237 RepID=A0AAF1KL14_9PROT|nr:protocatechuate 3,4-dioxygenase [Plastoroseomonas arctica]MBR0657270.1 intradiol ring-cleavage dioxygenase [Plastoroseomonas arctica]